MRTRTLTFVFAVLSLGALAQQATKPALEDKKGRFKIWGFISTGVQFYTGGFDFAATGNPVRGESLEQGLTFSCRSLDASVAQARGGVMSLRKGTMKGAVTVEVEPASGGGTSLASETVTLTSGTGEAVLELPGAFTLTNRAVGADGGTRTVTVKGPTATVRLDPLERQSKDPMRAVTVAGPSTIRIVNAKNGVASRDMTVKSNRLEYDRSARRLVLTGSVTIEGKDVPEGGPGFEGTMSGLDRVTIVFKDDLTVDRIQAQGAPGSAEVKEGGGG